LRRQENVSTLGANRKETRKKAFNEKNQNALAELDKTHSSAAVPDRKVLCRFHCGTELTDSFNTSSAATLLSVIGSQSCEAH
jgi:hypothetical protein